MVCAFSEVDNGELVQCVNTVVNREGYKLPKNHKGHEET
jgi:hypothetical protein